MFEDLKVSEWWFIGLAALAGFFVVKHFLDKLPGNQAEPQPGAQSGSSSDQRENTSKRDDFRGFEQKAGPGEQTNWFRRDEEEAARRAEQEAAAKAASASSNPTSRPWYQVLEVSSVANIENIRQAYKRKIRQYHPDKVAGLGPEFTTIAEAKAKAKEINEAFQKACAERGV